MMGQGSDSKGTKAVKAFGASVRNLAFASTVTRGHYKLLSRRMISSGFSLKQFIQALLRKWEGSKSIERDNHPDKKC